MGEKGKERGRGRERWGRQTKNKRMMVIQVEWILSVSDQDILPGQPSHSRVKLVNETFVRWAGALHLPFKTTLGSA